MKLQRVLWTGVLVVLMLGLAATPALAQAQDELGLSVRRDFGYGGFGGDVRGTFTMSVSGPTTIKSVTYLIDGQPMQTLDAEPFKLQFNTASYPAGPHDLSAVAVLADGRTLTSNVRHYTFLSAEQQANGFKNIILPLGAVLGVILLLMLGSQFFAIRTGKREDLPLGAPRSYGAFGGAICPRCHRPFSMHAWAFNVGLLSKFDRCPYCASWSVVKRVPMDQLHAAEQAEVAMASPEQPLHALSEEEKLRQQIDSSKYDE